MDHITIVSNGTVFSLWPPAFAGQINFGYSAHGKSTAHPARQFSYMLNPLCVSMLGGDQLARRQLESAVSSITERLTNETSESLVKKGLRYGLERRDLIRRQLSLKRLLRESIENEYKTIDAGDKCYTPSDAAFLTGNSAH